MSQHVDLKITIDRTVCSFCGEEGGRNVAITFSPKSDTGIKMLERAKKGGIVQENRSVNYGDSASFPNGTFQLKARVHSQHEFKEKITDTFSKIHEHLEAALLAALAEEAPGDDTEQWNTLGTLTFTWSSRAPT